MLSIFKSNDFLMLFSAEWHATMEGSIGEKIE
jgi:hypothetical protein